MSIEIAPFAVVFPDWFDEQAEHEHRSKGWLGDVEVHLADGPHFRLFFYDPVRLAQDLEENAKQGRSYLTEPNMVVVPEVSPVAIQSAVAGLFADRMFDHFQPLAGRSTHLSPEED